MSIAFEDYFSDPVFFFAAYYSQHVRTRQ